MKTSVIRKVLLPDSLGWGIAYGFIIWPLFAISIDLISPAIEPIIQVDDLGLALMPYSLVLIFLLAIFVLMRAVIRTRELSLINKCLIAVAGLPALFLWYAFSSFFLFLPGRVNPNF